MKRNTYIAFSEQKTKSQWLAWAGPKAALQQNCDRSGFNNYPIRMGFMSSSGSSCSSSSSAIGFGLQTGLGSNFATLYQTIGGPSMGNRCAQNPCSPGSNNAQIGGLGFVFVRDTLNCTTCNGRGRCVGNQRCYCQEGYSGNACQLNGISCFSIPQNSSNVCSGRGKCASIDNCICPYGYNGDECEFLALNETLCNGKPMSDPTVCSSRGNCTSENVCTCQPGFFGNDCQVTQCFGKFSNDSSVCSSNGKCNSKDVCSCNSGYSGSQCETFQCFGLNLTDSQVCSGKGTCAGANNCTCNNDYGGANCSQPICFGKLSSDSQVCSGNGKCTSPNVCSCNSGFSSQNCSITSCYSISSQDPTVCSGNGQCTAPNVCTCKTGYGSSDCSLSFCFGKAANDSSVCSGNGNCTKPNNCTCNSQYGGSNCSQPFCFGKLNGDSQVCSGNGVCSGPDQCQCNSGYAGNNCDIAICYNIYANETSVCSGKGQCVSPNNCSCTQGYGSSNCSLPLCFGRSSNEPLVCSGNGKCTVPNQCQCNSGFGSLNCSLPICYNFYANESNVCSGKGQCISPNNCSCQTGYTSNNCSQPLCFGISSNDPQVCSGNGQCSGPNNCTCNSQYGGSNCSQPFCFGMISSNAQVCSGNGRCISPDQCQCNSGFTGNNCSIPICFNINANESTVCSGKGQCVSPNNCSCAQGYGSSNCSQPLCFGRSSIDILVCSGNGQCIAPNQCQCNSGYGSMNCSIPICYNIYANESNVCSGKGQCVGPNNCSCQAGYTSNNCSQPFCFGKLSNDPQVCSGNGQCLGPNNCTCNSQYGGSNCSQPFCFGMIASNALVCSGNGRCLTPDQCQCNSNFTGFNCSIPICFNIYANESDVCSRNGSCIGPNQCQCNSGYGSLNCSQPICYSKLASDTTVCSGNGQCVSPNNCQCNSGFTHTNCSLPICFGKSSIDAQVCSGNGICLTPNNCSCNLQYGSSNCSLPFCFGKLKEDTQVCSGNGVCTGPNQCQCNSGYNGHNCSIPVCYNINGNETSVCSGKGQCTSPNTCLCNQGYGSSNCSLPLCFGIISTDSNVCSGKGSCVSPNQCQCNSGYGSMNCSIPICHNIFANESSVCSGKGQCLSPNNCLCQTGYTHSNCSIPICYNLNGNNPLVCSGKGVCSSPNNCSCTNGFGSLNCSQPICFGKLATESDSCFGNGKCIAPNNCTCYPGFSNLNCSQSGCFGISANHPNVCSGKGTCSSPDTCTCMNGYTGLTCQFPICNGKNGSNIDTVCSGNGKCVGPNQCQCKNGTTGNDCQNYICYDKISNDTTVCSGNGQCLSPNNCTCASGFTGYQCQTQGATICYNRAFTDPQVCSGNGQCIDFNKCVCKDGYSGSQCENYNCFGVQSSSSSVCSGVGKCLSPNQCQCPDGYTGNCSTPLCFSISALDSKTCSGNGKCLSPNLCSCSSGFSGFSCNITTCFGKASTDKTVCNGRGSCIGPNICQCKTGYFGNECQGFRCFNETVSPCSGHGICVDLNQCQCDFSSSTGFYSGERCNQCSQGYESFLWGCRDRVCSCNNRGTCDQNLKCSCTGNFNGTFCETCKFGYVGSNCSIECNPTLKCNSRGTCDQNGNCLCSTGFSGTNCQQCSTDYYGTLCNHFVSPNFAMSETGEKIVGKYLTPQTTTALDCLKIVHSDSLGLLGTSPICGFVGENVEIIFGKNPTFVKESVLKINAALYSTATFITVNVQFPLNPSTPTSELKSSNVIGSCDDATIDGSSSFDKSKRPLTYIWGLSNYGYDSLRNYLQTQTASIIKVPNTFFTQFKYNFTFSLQTKNFLGGISKPVQIDVMKYERVIPIVKILGPSVQQAQPNKVFQLNAEVSSCGSLNTNIEYRWNQPDSTKLNVIQREKSLIITSFPSLERTYTIEFIAKDVNGEEFKASVIVMIVLPPLKAVINGGSRSVSSGFNIEISGSSSNDPANEDRTPIYKWICSNNQTEGSCPATFKDQVVNNIQLPSGVWKITLLYQKGSRASTDTITLVVTDNFIPTVTITSLPERINLDIPIVVTVNITSPNGIGFTSEITWKAYSKNFLLTKEVTLSSLTSNTLIIKPFSLFYFDPVTFRVEARVLRTQKDLMMDTTQVDYGYAEVTTSANIPPSQSGFFAEPASGAILSTEFTLICSQWSDLENDYPLQYSFRFIDPSTKEEVVLSPFSLSSSIKTQLPPGDENNGYKLTIVVCVIDSLGALSRTSTTVVVTKPKFTSESSKLSFVTNSIETISKDSLSISSLSILSILNEKQICTNQNCTVDPNILNSRRNARDTLLSKLQNIYTTNTKDISPDQETISQQSFLLTQITKSPEELNTQGIQNVTSFLDSMINSNFRSTYSTGRFPEDIANSASLSLSQIFTTTSSNKNLTSGAERTLTNLLKNIISQKEVGEAPTVITQESFTLSGQRQNNNTIQGLNITLGNDGTKFNLPNDLKFSAPVDIQAINYAKNPYSFKNVTNPLVPANASQTSFVSLTFYNLDGSKMNISNLTTPITFELVGNFTPFIYSNVTPPNPCDPYDWECNAPPLPRQFEHSCKYWDTKREIWSTYGCKVNSTRNHSIICQCDHLTSFSTFVDLLPEFNYPKLDPNNPVPLSLSLAVCVIYLVIWLIVSAYEIYLWRTRKNIGREVEEEVDLKKLGFLVLLYELFKQNHIWFSLILRPKYASFNMIRSRRLTVIFNDLMLTIGVSTLMFGRDNKEIPTLILAAVISASIKLPFSKIIAFLFEKIKVWEYEEKKVLTVTPVLEESHLEMQEEDFYFAEAKQEVEDVYYCTDCGSEETTTNCSKCGKSLGMIEEVEFCLECDVPVKRNENCPKCNQPVKLSDQNESSRQLSPVIIVQEDSQAPLNEPNLDSPQKSQKSHKKKRNENRSDVEELRKKIKERKERRKRQKQSKVMAKLSIAQEKIDTTYERFLLFSKTSKFSKPISILMIIAFIIIYIVGITVFLAIMNFSSLQRQWHPVMNSILIGGGIFVPFLIIELVYWSSKRHHYQMTGEWTYPIGLIIYLILQIIFFVFVIGIVCIFGGIYGLFVSGFEVIFTVVFSSLIVLCSIIWLILYCIKPKKDLATVKIQAQGWPSFLILFVYGLVILIAIGMIILAQFFGSSYTTEKTIRWAINSVLGLIVDIFILSPTLVLVRAALIYLILPFINNSLSA